MATLIRFCFPERQNTTGIVTLSMTIPAAPFPVLFSILLFLLFHNFLFLLLPTNQARFKLITVNFNIEFST